MMTYPKKFIALLMASVLVLQCFLPVYAGAPEEAFPEAEVSHAVDDAAPAGDAADVSETADVTDQADIAGAADINEAAAVSDSADESDAAVISAEADAAAADPADSADVSETAAVISAEADTAAAADPGDAAASEGNGSGFEYPSCYAPDTLQAPDVDEYLRRSPALRRVEALGGSYSAVDERLISFPRSQGSSNLCWAFSVAASLEANSVKKDYFDKSVYLSPDALGYYFFNRVTDPLSLTENVQVTRTSSGKSSYFDNGGNVFNPVFMLMQWMNPLYEKAAPFTGEENTYPDMVDYAYDLDAVHLENAVWTASPAQDSIKNLVLKYGAACISVAMTGANSVSYNGAPIYTLYNDSRSVPNHAVTIVGWDDDIPASLFSGATQSRIKPIDPGAWLCKNSYTDTGYFYLSYEDASIVSTEYNNKAIAFDVGDSDNFAHNYGYDGGIGTNCAGRTGVIYGAEVFKADANPGTDTAESLQAVAFATNTAGASWSVDIYTEVDPQKGDPTAGILQKTQTGAAFTYPGYYTVRLDEPVYLNEGDYYSVVVRITSPKASSQAVLMYDDSYGSALGSWVYSVPNAQRGRSYLSVDGKTWNDTASHTLGDFYHSDSGHTPTSGYVRIKAFTDDTKATGQYIIDSDMVALIPDQVYTGEQLTPDPVIYYGTKRLVRDRDYEVAYGANKAVGKGSGTMTITGCGRYAVKSAIVRTFNIKKRSLADPYIEIEGLGEHTFTGEALEPVVVSFNGIELRKNHDYRIKYSKNDRTGDVKVTLTGKGSFTGKRRLSFSVVRRDIADEGITVKAIKDMDYKGEPLVPPVTIINSYNHRQQLTQGKDYTLEYFDNLLPGKAGILIVGTGNYCGNRLEYFNINGADLSKANISKISDATFTGDAIAPEITVYYGNKKLTESVDYEVNYSNNIDVGTATVSITGRRGTIYFGTSVSRTFNIRAAAINNATLENFGDVAYKAGTRYYTQNENKSDPNRLKVRLPGGYYLDPADYIISYENNYSIGSTVTATMTIKARGGNVTGSLTKEFSIVAGTKVLLNDFTNPDMAVEGFPSTRQFIYDASNHRDNADNSIKPNIIVKYKGKALVKDQDYVVHYHNNLGKGQAYLTIEAVAGSDYSGVRTEYFDIIGKPIYVTALGVADNDFYSKGPEDCVYDGSPQRPEIVIFEKILKDKTEKNKDGEGVKKLKENRDYTLKYVKNVDAGVASVNLKGIGDYSGEHTFTFNIESADLSQAQHASIKPVLYTGREVKPELYLKNKGGFLTEGVDYEVSYGENINAGKGTVIYTAKELTETEKQAGMVPNYVGQLTVSFAIKPRPIGDKTAIRVSGLNGISYNGERVEPPIQLLLNTGFGDIVVPESEYRVVYGKNGGAGKGSVSIRALREKDGGSGNFSGSRKESFAIGGMDMGLTRDILDSVTTPYTRSRAKLNLGTLETAKGSLTQGTDFTVKTDGRKDAGQGSYSLIGKGQYKGSLAYGMYTITPMQVEEGGIEIRNLKPGKYTSASNPVKCPKMKVYANKKMLKKGVDYVVTYYNNTAVGTANMVVSLVNNYSGSIIAPFEIIQ